MQPAAERKRTNFKLIVLCECITFCVTFKELGDLNVNVSLITMLYDSEGVKGRKGREEKEGRERGSRFVKQPPEEKSSEGGSGQGKKMRVSSIITQHILQYHKHCRKTLHHRHTNER